MNATNRSLLAPLSTPLMLALAACGGGSDGGSPPAAPPASSTVVFQRWAGGTQTDLYAVGEDGTGPALLAGTAENESFQGVTPGGRVIFARKAGGLWDVFAVDLDGTGLVGLGNTDCTSEHVQGITPGGRVVFLRLDFSTGLADLHVIEADGTGEVHLAADAFNYYGVSPGGRVIFDHSTAGGLYGVREDGTGLVTLSTTASSDPFRAITPAGRVIFRERVSGQHDLYGVDDDGTGLVALAGDPEASESFAAVIANERVVFSRLDAARGQDDLFSVREDGSGLATLANTAAHEGFLGVLSTGRILFSRLSGTAPFQTDLYLVDADGTDELRLTSTPGASETALCGVACEAPGGRVLFLRGGDVFSIDPDGTDERGLASSLDHETLLGVTAGGRVTFAREAGGTQGDLFAIDADGTDLRALADGAEDEYPVTIH